MMTMKIGELVEELESENAALKAELKAALKAMRNRTPAPINWTKDRPNAEGWYFWRRAKNVNDIRKWLVYFVEKTPHAPVWLFEIQCKVPRPKGGWWARIETPKGS